MSKILFILLILVGLINFLPVVGILSAAQLESAYAIKLLSNDVIILMRHRALLFGILGGFVLYSAFKPNFRQVAMIMAGVSMLGFMVLAHLTGDFNTHIKKVLMVDYVGILLLFFAGIINWKLKLLSKT